MRFLLALFLFAAPAWAVLPDERLADPALEARARALSKELRCVVCHNESIDDSNATLARDIRIVLRERLAAGDSDGQAKAYLVARYGDFVLLRPPVRADTYLLWFGPFALLALGGAVAFAAQRRRKPAAPAPLTPEEQARLAALLREEPK
ncbi:MAG: cytochrome c-type biogenesis protein CcmH [Alphaproteobacteria bacterium]|nr:cytochrome c-type biogenesis protein CcmH [Alphaproteobacteria bacterium]